METPGITAFCASVTVPESVALDWARAGIGASSPIATATAAINLNRSMNILRAC
jgi:hypothetical protein